MLPLYALFMVQAILDKLCMSTVRTQVALYGNVTPECHSADHHALSPVTLCWVIVTQPLLKRSCPALGKQRIPELSVVEKTS